MGSLDGRVAIITGAGRGLGREHALLFAAEGAKVVVNDRGGTNEGTGEDESPANDVVAEIQAAGGEAVANTDDIADWLGAQNLVNTAIDAFGGLDILVNNAGILRDRVLVNMSEEEWDAVIRVHLKGHFAPSRWAAAYWREEAKSGREKPRNIVHTSSTSGLFANPGQSNYGAAKSGIATFSQILAKELVRYGVKSNCIAPAARTRLTMATPGLDEIMAAKQGDVRRLGPGQRVAARRLPVDRRLPVHRRDVLRPGWRRQAGPLVGDGRDRRALGDVDGGRARRGADRLAVAVVDPSDPGRRDRRGAMKYMMFVCTDAEPDPPTGDPKLDDVEDWVARHDASGARVTGEALRPTSDATTVRVRGGKVLVTDGPFAETREWIAGFDILECGDLDEAIAIASEHPMARFGRLELRPFWDDDGGRSG